MLLLLVMSVFGFGNTANAQTRTKISEGVTLVNYGSFQIIEDDNRQQSIRVEVKETTKKDESTGGVLYAVFCDNKLIRNTVRSGIAEAIAWGLKNTKWGENVPGWLVKSVANAAYDSACDYLKKKNW